VIIYEILKDKYLIRSSNENFTISLIENENTDNLDKCKSNLSKILEKMEYFMSKNQNQDFDSKYIDINKIVYQNSQEEIIKLVQICFIFLICSEKKEKFINYITLLKENQQTCLMNLVNEILHHETIENENKEEKRESQENTKENDENEFIDHIKSLEFDKKVLLSKLEQNEILSLSNKNLISSLRQENEALKLKIDELVMNFTVSPLKNDDLERLSKENEFLKEEILNQADKSTKMIADLNSEIQKYKSESSQASSEISLINELRLKIETLEV